MYTDILVEHHDQVVEPALAQPLVLICSSASSALESLAAGSAVAALSGKEVVPFALLGSLRGCDLSECLEVFETRRLCVFCPCGTLPP